MSLNQIVGPLLTHLEIALAGVVIGALVAIPTGALLKSRPRLATGCLAVVDVIQTVPTLAMLAMLMLLLGLNDRTVIVAIVLYSLFPILRNTYTGILEVDPGIVRAGRGIGMTPLQLFGRVELPLALPVILSGIRIAFVTALGIATTGVLIGSGGLGMLIWRGIQTRNAQMLLSGAIPVSLLAIGSDALLNLLQKKLVKR